MQLKDILAQRKHFTHLKKTLDEEVLEQVNTDTGRYYKSPTGALYPSVTTVTGLMNEKSIQQWRQRVGNEEANKISSKASVRGTRMHELFEKYLDNEEIDSSKYNYNDTINFGEIKPFLDNYIDNIHLQETRLYSDFLQMAGTVDCVAEWKGKLSIIDFKTATKHKNRDYITNYFCQAAAYAIMYEERFQIPVNRIVILISVDGDTPQVFEDRRDDFVKQLLEVRHQYKVRYDV
jgi:genome maintenance exonuclease 1